MGPRAVELEPVVDEGAEEVLRAGVGEQPLRLGADPGLGVELAARGGVEERGVRRRAPDQVREPGRPLVAVEPAQPAREALVDDALLVHVVELRRLEDHPGDDVDALGEGEPRGGARLRVDAAEPVELLDLQRAAERLAAELLEVRLQARVAAVAGDVAGHLLAVLAEGDERVRRLGELLRGEHRDDLAVLGGDRARVGVEPEQIARGVRVLHRGQPPELRLRRVRRGVSARRDELTLAAGEAADERPAMTQRTDSTHRHLREVGSLVQGAGPRKLTRNARRSRRAVRVPPVTSRRQVSRRGARFSARGGGARRPRSRPRR